MKTITIIAARGASKRLPRKNTKLFCGRPLIAWSIIQSRACELIDETYVTTDDDEIASIAEEYGAKVLIREDYRESLDPTTGIVPYVAAAKRILKEREYDCIMAMLPTSPLWKPHDLRRLIQRFEVVREDKDIVDVRPFLHHTSLAMYAPMKDVFLYKRIDHEKCVEAVMDKTFLYLALCGGSAISNKEDILKHKIDWNDEATWRDPVTFELNSDSMYYITGEWWQTYEIDYQTDFDVCEYFFEKYLLAEWEAIFKNMGGVLGT